MARASAALLATTTMLVACAPIRVAPDEDTGVTPPAGCASDADCVDDDRPCLSSSCGDAGTCTQPVQKPNTCFVSEQCFAPGQEQPGDRCKVCDPESNAGALVDVVCDSGTCDSETGQCVVIGDPGPPDVDDVEDTQDSEDAPDTEETVDLPIDAPDTGPGPCEVNEDCIGVVALEDCQTAACVSGTGECVAVELPTGSACAPAGVQAPECYDGTCNADGDCEATPLSNSACDDNDACTLGDVCAEGVCLGASKSCTDGNGCTLDSCDAESGECLFQVFGDGLPCDDGFSCMVGDVCADGECVGSDNVCPCEAAGDCADVEDGDQCNGVLECAGSGDGEGGCVIDPDSVVQCDLSGDDACNATVCDPETGACESSPQDGAGCDDGDPCTFADKCDDVGQCAGTPQLCDDQSVCTTDACVEGECSHENNTGPCNDEDVCTSDDSCADGECLGTPKVCDDANVCTSDSCTDTGNCSSAALNGEPCEDGSVCTIGDTCVAAVCAGGALECDDSEVCTDDGCDPVEGCTFAPNDSNLCSDDDLCTTGDSCLGGECVPGSPLDCSTSVPCKVGSCDGANGCVTTDQEDGAACDDSNDCTEGELCTAGLCGGGVGVCGCTSDAQCDDEDPCTGVETCVGEEGTNKTCESGPDIECDETGEICTANVCNPLTGGCEPQSVAEGQSCGPDTACETGLQCGAGVCSGTPIPCPTIGCQTPTGCDGTSGCQYVDTPPGTACDDGDPCTLNDACDAAGGCLGAPNPCDDGNTCTANACSPGTGCANNPLADGSECDANGDPCTGDSCESGVCVSGGGAPCNDGVDCTTDSCGATGNCEFTLNHAACDDGNPCTVNSCTAPGCQMVPSVDFASCSDGNSGTAPDICLQGVCSGASPHSAAPTTGFCLPQDVQSVALAIQGANVFSLGNYRVKSLGFAGGVPQCVSPITQKVQVNRISSTGAILPFGSAADGLGAAMADGLAVGGDGLVGHVGDGAVVWNGGDLFDEITAQLSPGVNFAAVGHTSTQVDATEITSHFLVAGRTGSNSKGLAALCSDPGGAWTCDKASVSGLSAAALVPTAAILRSQLDCTTPGCLIPTALAGGWLGSQSTNSKVHLFESPLAESFGLAKSVGSNPELEGAVQEGPFVTWFFGGGGFLMRCEASDCDKLSGVWPLQSTLSVVDAFAYSGGVVFLVTQGLNGLVFFLPTGADATQATSWTMVGLTNIDVPVAIAGTGTLGIYVLGHDAAESEYVLRFFAKK